MPLIAESGTQGLRKNHRRGCTRKPGDDLTVCRCSWSGRHNGKEVVLAKWCKKRVDPHSKTEAKKVLIRFRAAVEGPAFDPNGEQPDLGSDQLLRHFIKEWLTHYAEEQHLRSKSLIPMLNVLAPGLADELRADKKLPARRRPATKQKISDGLGHYTLERLAGSSLEIERWLNKQAKDRGWTNNTWLRYYELLSTLCVRATKWKTGNVPRMRQNPMQSIERRVGSKRVHAVHDIRISEEDEARLFAACDLLNRVQHKSTRGRLTQDQADEIRRQVLAGELQTVVAKQFKVSPPTVNGIVKGETWNPAKYRVGTKGTEMRRRLIGALDSGPRAGEMMQIQIKHVNWTPTVTIIDGQPRKTYEIALPAAITKGGATTGEIEYLYAGTERFVQMLEQRRFQLRRRRDDGRMEPDPEGYIFGTESGKRQKGFRRMWQELFRLAGIRYGRKYGIVWHTTRHEFISRTAEQTGDDSVATMELARHHDLRTTQGYLHGRKKRLAEIAARRRTATR